MAIIGATDLGNGPLMVVVDHDPRAVATDCPSGSIVLSLMAGIYGWQFVKNDDGSTTNVSIQASGVDARTLTAGAGLTGGGDLSVDRTFDVGAHPDGSIIVNANDVQVGVLATDAQHGTRGGGTQHSAATGAVAGFMSAADKTKLDALPASAAPTSRTLTAGAGLIGGGDLSADRTFAVVYGSTAGTSAQGNDARLSDDRAASGIRTATTIVSTSGAAAPSVGQVLTATGASAATWQTPAAGSDSIKQTIYQALAVDTTTTSTAYVVLMTQNVTTVASSKLDIRFSVSVSTSNANRGVRFRLRVDGTTRREVQVSTSSTANWPSCGCLEYVQTGLAAGAHTIVIDWAMTASTGQIRASTTSNFEGASLVVQEVSL